MERDSRNEGIRDEWRADVAYFVSPPSSCRLPRISKDQSFPPPLSGFRIGRAWRFYSRMASSFPLPFFSFFFFLREFTYHAYSLQFVQIVKELLPIKIIDAKFIIIIKIHFSNRWSKVK